MMASLLWNPTSPRLQADVERTGGAPVEGEPCACRHGFPVDVREDENGYAIVAELPGSTASDWTLRVEEAVLTVSADRPAPVAAPEEVFRRIERCHGRFQRTFALPDGVAPEAITATCQDGVLTIAVPKRPECKPRTISVQG